LWGLLDRLRRFSRGSGLYHAGREMGRKRKTFEAVVSGRSDKNIRFAAVRTLLLGLGFEERISGSHHVFRRGDIAELVNLQELQGGKVKPYQVRQLRELLLKYRERLGYEE
jgi:predicted RNA binding protein YcfA (HicA-like mRNA interferase family)